MKLKSQTINFALVFSVILILCVKSQGAIQTPRGPNSFKENVREEIQKMKTGARGLACQVLIERLESATKNTQIVPLDQNELNWHPNDRRGTRSHVVAQDTQVRGSSRSQPTSAIIYLNPDHIDPNLSPFRVGYFPFLLAEAADLNEGTFSGDYQIRIKRAAFFQNGWRDSNGSSMNDVVNRVPTEEYQKAKNAGLIVEEFSKFFPILNLDEYQVE